MGGNQRLTRRALLGALPALLLLGRPARPISLTELLALSRFLTGFERLSPVLGRRYLATLSRRERRGLRALYERLGLASATPPASLDELSDEQLFGWEAGAALADRLVDYWCQQRVAGLPLS